MLNMRPSGERMYNTGVPHSTILSMLTAARASVTAASTGRLSATAS